MVQRPEPGSVPAFDESNPRSTIITKKDMIRERSLNAAAGKKSKQLPKQGLNPYAYMPKSRQSQFKRSNTAGKPSSAVASRVLPSQRVNDAGEVHIPRFNEQLDLQSVKKSQGP